MLQSGFEPDVVGPCAATGVQPGVEPTRLAQPLAVHRYLVVIRQRDNARHNPQSARCGEEMGKGKDTQSSRSTCPHRDASWLKQVLKSSAHALQRRREWQSRKRPYTGFPGATSRYCVLLRAKQFENPKLAATSGSYFVVPPTEVTKRLASCEGVIVGSE